MLDYNHVDHMTGVRTRYFLSIAFSHATKGKHKSPRKHWISIHSWCVDYLARTLTQVANIFTTNPFSVSVVIPSSPPEGKFDSQTLFLCRVALPPLQAPHHGLDLTMALSNGLWLATGEETYIVLMVDFALCDGVIFCVSWYKCANHFCKRVASTIALVTRENTYFLQHPLSSHAQQQERTLISHGTHCPPTHRAYTMNSTIIELTKKRQPLTLCNSYILCCGWTRLCVSAQFCVLIFHRYRSSSVTCHVHRKVERELVLVCGMGVPVFRGHLFATQLCWGCARTIPFRRCQYVYTHPAAITRIC